MFLADLNEDQKRAFLVLALRIAQSDGEDSADEREALEGVCQEMGIPYEVDMQSVLAGINIAPFDTHRSRVIATLELMRMLYADDYLHEGEVAEIAEICKAMEFPGPWVASMTEWAKRMAWTEDNRDDARRDQFHAELVDYAKNIMEDRWR